MTEAPDADDGATNNDGATEDNYAENEDPSTMGKSALASKKNSGTKRVGPKTTGDDVFDVDASDKKQRASKPSSAPRWSLNQTKGFTVNPYSKGSKSRVDIVVHDSGVPADDRKPNIKLDVGGRSVEFEWKLPESHFSDEQAEVQAIDRNSSRYSAYEDTMDKMHKAGTKAVDGFFRGTSQVVDLNVECTGVPTTQRYNILTDKTVYYKGREHIQFDSMYVTTLKVAKGRHSRVKATKEAGIAAFGKLKSEPVSGRGNDGGGGGGGGGGKGWSRGDDPNRARHQHNNVQDESSDSSSDDE